MSIDIASKNMQKMLGKDDEILLDFCYLKLGSQIGVGATAKVYKGTYKRKTVAVKVFSPPEILEDDVDAFSQEARLAATLVHENIVITLGLCVRPPQIAMITEFCEHGSLQDFVKENHLHDFCNVLWKLRCAIDAISAVRYLHSISVLHRDIKLGNFFLTANGIVKLGDFGESTLFDIVDRPNGDVNGSGRGSGNGNGNENGNGNGYAEKRGSSGGRGTAGSRGHNSSCANTRISVVGRSSENSLTTPPPPSSRKLQTQEAKAKKTRNSLAGFLKQKKTSTKMSIVGTVTNMAPEMINNASQYSEAVDVYSLGVTMWEIWTGLEPFSNCNQFQIYKLVGEEGKRPTLPPETNAVYKTAVNMAWDQDPNKRAGAQELLHMLRKEHDRIVEQIELQRMNGLMEDERLPKNIPRCFRIMREKRWNHREEEEEEGGGDRRGKLGLGQAPSFFSKSIKASKKKLSGRKLMMGGQRRTKSEETEATTKMRAESEMSDITMADFDEVYQYGVEEDENCIELPPAGSSKFSNLV